MNSWEYTHVILYYMCSAWHGALTEKLSDGLGWKPVQAKAAIATFEAILRKNDELTEWLRL